MVKLETYKCDRCKKEFTVEEGENPEGIVIDSFGEEVDHDLCSDCIAVVAYMMEYVKEFDALADKLAKKESGEE